LQILCLLAGLCLSGPAAGQSGASEAMTAARELVVAVRAADQVKALLLVMLQQLKPAVAQGRPEVEKAYDQIAPMMIESMNERLGQFAEGMAALYATNFSAEELREIIAFYRRPTGQKFLQKLPEITQQGMLRGQKFGQAAIVDIQSRMKQELRRRGHNI
jgi:hypothetical protein